MNNIQQAKLAAENKKAKEEQDAYQNLSQTARMKNRQDIMDDIKNERFNQGLTQRELAKKAGMSQASITRAERNLWVSLNTIIRITVALGKEIRII